MGVGSYLGGVGAIDRGAADDGAYMGQASCVQRGDDSGHHGHGGRQQRAHAHHLRVMFPRRGDEGLRGHVVAQTDHREAGAAQQDSDQAPPRRRRSSKAD